MYPIKRFLSEASIDLVKYYCFDFDGVVAYPTVLPDNHSYIINIRKVMSYRKKNSVTYTKAAKALKFGRKEVEENVHLVRDLNKLNPAFLDAVKRIQKRDGKIILATNNAPELVKPFLAKNKILKYFTLLYSPESAGMIWKPFDEYFRKLKDKLGCEYEEMMLYDDQVENDKAMIKLGGHAQVYRMGRPFVV